MDLSQRTLFAPLTIFVINVLFGKHAQKSTRFPQMFYQYTILPENNVSILFHTAFMEIIVHALLLSIDLSQLLDPCRF
jgi:hypothetical protein